MHCHFNIHDLLQRSQALGRHRRRSNPDSNPLGHAEWLRRSLLCRTQSPACCWPGLATSTRNTGRISSLWILVGSIGPGTSLTNQNCHIETQISTIENAFEMFTERQDIAILLINQHVCGFFHDTQPFTSAVCTQVAEKIRPLVDRYQRAFPALLEIPSKDHPYDPSKDSVLKRVQKLFGE